MMIGFRVVFGLLLLAGVYCFGMYIYTSEPVWRRRGVYIVLSALGLALVFFAGLAVQTLPELF
ncbi:MAG TPA: hypothetical protein VK876_11440 [Rubrivivax sp.]|nr:hypothetical protein [Rubrivivax sp.]